MSATTSRSWSRWATCITSAARSTAGRCGCELTPRGRQIRDVIGALFARHAEGLEAKGVLGPEGIEDITTSLKRVERYWTDQIRYIY